MVVSSERPPYVERKAGFPPVSRRDARLLILGTLPGDASISRGEYYGHPRNHFWPIIRRLFLLPDDVSYRARGAALKSARIALWDVYTSAERAGSLDANIRVGAVNDFGDFFEKHSVIDTIAFNGQGAARYFQRHVVGPGLINGLHFKYVVLPSTSPAYTMPFEQKLERWRELLQDYT